MGKGDRGFPFPPPAFINPDMRAPLLTRIWNPAPARLRRGVFPAAALALAATLAAGCTTGYETTTSRGERIKEWFLEREGGGIEAYAVWPAEKGRHPALLLIHGAGGRAQRFRSPIFTLARGGVVAMAISLPGSGESTGPDDFNGPRAVAAIVRAAAFLAQDSRVRPEAIAVYGIGAGAAAALLAAAESPHIRLAAVQDGGYDLEEIFGNLSENKRLRMRLRLGGTPKEKPEAYRIRSPIRRLAGLRGPVLILHAEKPRAYPLFQADALADALRAKGHPHRLIVIPGGSEELNLRLPSIKRRVLPFLREHLESGGNRG